MRTAVHKQRCNIVPASHQDTFLGGPHESISQTRCMKEDLTTGVLHLYPLAAQPYVPVVCE